MKYRPEVDGLRAVAVLSVLVYHAKLTFAGIPLLTGGYIGVDVFFVISGYLITSIILREVEAGKFSYLSFYERRARRILPALFAVMLASIPFAWFFLLPNALTEYASSVLASLLFTSNILFWLQDSYTAAPSELKPFLHTWSLSVEEQFYLFFPILLFALWRIAPQKILFAFCVLFISSLILAQVGSVYFSDANFFLLPSRGWELLAGGILAQAESKKITLLPNTYRSSLVNAAFVVLLASFFMFTESTAHPSLITLVPVLATVIIIANYQDSVLATRVLSWPLVVFVGLVSYSLYLWHFPVFAFARISGQELTNLDKLGLLALSFVLSVIAYYAIEKPLRHRDKWPPKKLMTLLGLVFVCLFSVQLYFYTSGGAVQRLGSVEELFTVSAEKKISNGEHNVDGAQSTLINVGDSHAGVLASPLLEFAHKNKANFVHMDQPGCALAPGVFRFDNGKHQSRCSKIQDNWMSQVESYKNAVLIYTARFNLYFTGERFDNQEGGVEPGYTVLLTDKKNGQQNIEGLKLRVISTIKRLLDIGHKIILVYPIPEAGWDVPNLVKVKLSGVPAEEKLDAFEDLSLSTSLVEYRKRSQHTFDMYDRIGQHQNLVRVYPDKKFCSERKQRCYVHDDRRLYYYDDNHLAPYAASLVVNDIEKVILDKGWFR